MSTATRQNSLFAAQDWTKLYETFRSADFQSYDFETLRASMISYLQQYYPEDFNDFIESSEYVALLDMIAFLGQSLAFRMDLNARENFIDTAERRDSILKLARLLSYSPKRNVASSGLIKIDSISTTESLTDSLGTNLSNFDVSWNDTSNSNWAEQFSIILNAALINGQSIGIPGNSNTINGIAIDEYSINILANAAPIYPFSTTVSNTQMNFEVASATTLNQQFIYEVDPTPNSKFTFLFQNDGQGNGSNNTGYFMYFTQGTLTSLGFGIAETIPNQVISIAYNNINNSDVWLYDLNNDGTTNNLWTQVPAIAGVNAIYNNSTSKNLYQVNSRLNDQIDLVFGDGSFSNMPQGNFLTYFRVSNGLSYKITPDEMQAVSISINYISRNLTIETLTIQASLKYTVVNSTPAETIDSIRQKAPQQYYTQSRMISAEDYNILPLTTFSDIVAVKAINRTSSGISSYLDILDASGTYSSTNSFAQDGYLYLDQTTNSVGFNYTSTSTVQLTVQNIVDTILSSKELMHFYYANFPRYLPSPTNSATNLVTTFWTLSAIITNGSTGYFSGPNDVATITTPQIYQVGSVTSRFTNKIQPGAIIKFSAPVGQYFNAQNNLVTGLPKTSGDKLFLYSTVIQLVGDGTNGGIGVLPNGQGAVTLSSKIPSGAIISEMIPAFKNSITPQVMTQIVNRVLSYNNFALRYDLPTNTWDFVELPNINQSGEFSFAYAGNINGVGLDASWLIQFAYTSNIGYAVTSRSLNYIFQSVYETRFYYDPGVKVYDSATATIINDQITVLRVNSQPDSAMPLGVDYQWNIYKNFIDADGYQDQSKVMLTFSDDNYDGIPDNPDIFDIIVNPTVNPQTKLVFFQIQYNGGFMNIVPVDSATIVSDYATLAMVQANAYMYINGQVFYATTDNLFYILTVTTTPTGKAIQTVTPASGYITEIGRQNLYFQYTHNSPDYRRIDPSTTNIMDIFLLTSEYASSYTAWIQDTTNTLVMPLPPTTDQLMQSYGTLSLYKAMSDTIIFNSAVFKPLFGNKAASALQGTFKVIKNASTNISDNELQTNVVAAINAYFAIGNWNFGDTFYFSELSAYLHQTLTPYLSSVVLVPVNTNSVFGNLYQINSEANEILISAATVDNVQVISTITASQLNVTSATINN